MNSEICIAFVLLSAENAVGQLERLESSISKLDHNPRRFRSYDKEPWKSKGLRLMPVDNDCVFYIPEDAPAEVTVIRILNEGRNADAEL